MRAWLFASVLTLIALATACVTTADKAPGSGSVHRWWAGLGPVLPHDSFPGDCKLCHVGDEWDTLKKNFTFDHGKETGVELAGAHKEARCLRCHNDRGRVDVFMARGCGGCHEDVHQGDLGPNCTQCHQQRTWRPENQVEMHNRTRFPLTGAHALTSCHRCHPGTRVGNIMPTDTACATCHADEAAATTNPPHANLGWVDNCDRCHMPTTWNQATVQMALRGRR